MLHFKVTVVFLPPMNLFYAENIEGDFAYLSVEEAAHIVRVLRKREGEELNFTDGKGTFYKGTIVETGKKKCILKITERGANPSQRNYHLHIAIAPTKNINRYEWFLEKATEIGLDTVSPILCAHSERTRVRTDRLQKILVSASKQSLQMKFPLIQDLVKFNKFLQNIQEEQFTQKFIAHCEEDGEKTQLTEVIKPEGNILILIGPEGDFSEQEIEAAKAVGFLPVALGNSRLRTETAGIYAAAIASASQFT